MTQADRIEEKLDQLLSLMAGVRPPSPAIKSSATRLIELARVNPRAAIDEAKRLARADRKPSGRKQ